MQIWDKFHIQIWAYGPNSPQTRIFQSQRLAFFTLTLHALELVKATSGLAALDPGYVTPVTVWH